MTSYNNSSDFLMGTAILSKYMTEDLSVDVYENTSISISGLKSISSEEDRAALGFLGWDFGKDKDGGSWAQYVELEYVDT
jgi:hypothetical protein